MTLRSILAACSLAFFLLLVQFSVGWLGTEAGGAFDGRVLGYGLTDARAYLGVLKAEQTAFYLGAFRFADTLFPALLAVTLVLWLRPLWRGAFRLAVLVLVAIYLGADYTENALVARLLEQGPEMITERAVTTASLFTQVKWGALAICLLALIPLAWRRPA